MMKALLIALTMIATLAAQDDKDLAAVVDKTVKAWVSRTDIGVTDDARRAIHAEAQSLRRVLLDIEAANPVREKWSMVSMLIRHYCFEVRDLRLRGRPSAQNPVGVMAFQPATVSALDERDVKRAPLREVIERIFDGLRPKPVGYIEFRSTPDRGVIVIEGQARGFTNRVYVITTGAYVVEIRRTAGKPPCRMRLTVQPAAMAIAACDS